jgi:BatD DUF11 like domain
VQPNTSDQILSLRQDLREAMKFIVLIKSRNIVTILRLRLLAVIFALLLGGLASAQVKFSTVANSREVGRGEYVQIEFVVENAKTIDHLTPPVFSDFQVVQGPIQSSGMSIVNGVMSQYKAISFVLQPNKTGKFTITGATATVDGKPMRSNPVTIEVNATGSSKPNSNPPPPVGAAWPGEPLDVDREYTLKPGENIADKIRKNLFVKVLVNKTSCYVGESIMATYKLYSRLQSESRVTKLPSLNGFSVYDMMDPNAGASSVETVNGKPFTVHTIRKTQLIPLQAGTIELDPVEVENTVHFVKVARQERPSGNPLDELFGRFSDEIQGIPVDQHITLDTKPVGITVKPLPVESRPPGFNGAVGHFSINAAFENKNITAQDAAVLKVTVKGNGNLPVVNAPSVQWPAGFESYDPSAKEQIDKTVFPLGGSKTFEYNFIPKAKGDYTIPPVEISYFDPVSQSYKSVQSQPLLVTVAPAVKKAPTTQPPASDSKSTEKMQGFSEFLQNHLEWLFAILIFSGLAFYLGMQNRRNKKVIPAAVEEKMEEPDQPMIRIDPLEKPKELLNSGEYKYFYSELNRSVWKAVADKLNLPSSELNKQNIIVQLLAKGMDSETTLLFSRILNECEMNLYTPSYNMQNMEALLGQTESLLEKLQ